AGGGASPPPRPGASPHGRAGRCSPRGRRSCTGCRSRSLRWSCGSSCPLLVRGQLEALPDAGGRVGGHAGEGRDLPVGPAEADERSEEHTSELQSRENLVCRLLLEKKK